MNKSPPAYSEEAESSAPLLQSRQSAEIQDPEPQAISTPISQVQLQEDIAVLQQHLLELQVEEARQVAPTRKLQWKDYPLPMKAFLIWFATMFVGINIAIIVLAIWVFTQ